MTPQPFLHTTPDELLETTVETVIDIPFHTGNTRQFRIVLPTSIDSLLDHPSTHAAFAQDEYMPYWAELWPSALMLGRALAQQPWPEGIKVLEVGCGLGVTGLIALALGMEVTFSDYDAAALKFAAKNAQINGLRQFHTLPLDWRYPPKNMTVPLVLAADVIYESRNISPLLNLLNTVMGPTGECWLSDPDRPQKEEFQSALSEHGFAFEAMATTLERPQQPLVKGTVYRIWRDH